MNKDFTFERDTTNDPFFNSKDEEVSQVADMIKKAISNDFTLKYNDDTVIKLGMYSRNDYTIKYSYKEEENTSSPYKIRKMPIKTNRLKFVDYFLLDHCNPAYFQNKIKDNDKYFIDYLLINYFSEHGYFPKNKDIYLIWRTDIYLDKQLYESYYQKIRFVYEKE
jgi:hypothetical protein